VLHLAGISKRSRVVLARVAYPYESANSHSDTITKSMTSPQSLQPNEPVSQATQKYHFSFEPLAKQVSALYQGVMLADSDNVMLLQETRIAPVHYFPREAVRMDLFERSDFVSYCPFRGNATHYSLRVGDIAADNILWSYEDPLKDAAGIKGYVAFYTDQVNISFPGELSAQPASQASTAYENPLLNWVLQEAPGFASSSELTAAFARQMRSAQIPLWRLSVSILTLHPQVVAVTHHWHSVTGELVELEHDFGLLQSPEYLNSPLLPIFEGAGGIRRRLDIKEPLLDFGLLSDLHAEGATDYVAMPLHFSDGQINALTISSNRPGGFTTADLGHIYEILAVLGRIYEVHALQHKAASLLDTYLGSHAGERVLDGLIRRGDGQDIQAVIWFCDLRGSTSLAQAMSRVEFLALLNDFFDCVAGAVLDHDGQILRFIGDAALAIFPFDEELDDTGLRAACERAIAAAREASSRMKSYNARRVKESLPELGYGIGLHVGEVTYGNIGTGRRLEFTVIGEAANLAARIESLCKLLGESVLVSADFASCEPDQVVSMGEHPLSGIDAPVEIFALRDPVTD
jgi:adenylate cyclase